MTRGDYLPHKRRQGLKKEKNKNHHVVPEN